jgi:hypothetical protein
MTVPPNDAIMIEKIDYLPDLTLGTAKLLESGLPVSFHHHLKDILKHYDVVQVPTSFLGDLSLPKLGKFFLITPELPDDFWNSKLPLLQNTRSN